MRLHYLAAILLVVSAAPVWAQYLPPALWGNAEQQHYMEESQAYWMKPAHEPSLWLEAKSGKASEQYRILVERWGPPDYITRMEVFPDGTALATKKTLDSPGNERPTRIANKQTVPLNAKQADHFKFLFYDVGYWQDGPELPERVVNGLAEICVDGETYTFEAVRADKYRFFTMRCDLDRVPGMARLVEELDALFPPIADTRTKHRPHDPPIE